MHIDAHQHFWKYDPEQQDWITDDMSAIRKSFYPGDLKPLLEGHSIDGCVAVQADQTTEENNFLLNLASENDFIKGVVGWVDLQSSEVEQLLEIYTHEPKMKGFRHVVQSEADPKFLLRPDFLRGISKLGQYGYTYDILIFPHQLGAVLEFVRKFPNQKFVIDHLGKPYIKDGLFEGWATLIKAIGTHKNVYCKLSGMVTEADTHSWKPADILPYMEHVLKVFGADRLMFGSDWPVCLLASDYKKVMDLVTDFVAQLSVPEQKNIMGSNAAKFYNLNIS